MTEDMYIEDFRTLDEIVDFVEKQIQEKYKEYHQPKQKGLKKELETLLKNDYPSVVEEYGLKDGEELPDVLATRIIHELFAKCVRSVYLLWYEENRTEIDDDSPYSAYEFDRTIARPEIGYRQFLERGLTPSKFDKIREPITLVTR